MIRPADAGVAVFKAVPRHVRSRKFKKELERMVLKEMGPREHAFLRSLPGFKRKLIMRSFMARAERDGLMDGALRLVETVQARIPEMVAKSHRNVLDKIVPPNILEIVSRLEWSVLRAEPHSYVLGDVGALARDTVERALCGALLNRFALSEATEMYLPIDHSACLFGRRSVSIKPVTIEKINLASAECSREFIVCSRLDDNKKELQSLIGARARFFDSDMDVDKVFQR